MSSVNNLILIGGAATAIAAIGFLLGKTFRLFRSWFKFMDEWYGTEDKPGVTKRLSEGNARFDCIEGELKIIKEELFNNHGSSLRDAIDRIEAAVSKEQK